MHLFSHWQDSICHRWFRPKDAGWSRPNALEKKEEHHRGIGAPLSLLPPLWGRIQVGGEPQSQREM